MFNRSHLLHHTIVLGILLLGIGFALLFSADKNFALIAIFATGIIYAAYGIVHHHIEHDLTVKIVVEYVLVALLVVALFLFVRGGL